MKNLTKSQLYLIKIVQNISRKGKKIPVGPDETDTFGRKLKLESQAVDSDNYKLKKNVLSFLKKLQKNGSELETVLKGEVMWYDIRSSIWSEYPIELSSLIALAYATVLMERTGRKTGHTLNIAIDCYKKHFESMSIFVDTIVRTGLCNDGGGIIYWGVQNGGMIRNVSQYERATTGKNGNWIYGTMSHKIDDFFGAKFGMMGKVFCGPNLMEDLYGKLIRGKFPDLLIIDNPEDFVVNVGDLSPNTIDVVEDLVRTRTGTKEKRNEILKNVKVGVNMSGSPVGKSLVDLLRAFGADLTVENEKLDENFNTENVIDPNEHDSEPMELLKKKAKKDGRIYLSLDPDGDRGTIIAKGSDETARSLTGTELLLLATENLSTYNKENLDNDVIYDMRTGISITDLSKALKKKGIKSNVIAAEPGYPFFMEAMSENKSAAIAVENTCHAFIPAFTNPLWGAPKYYPLVQGGDDASIFLTYILALSTQMWKGRNPVMQLEYLRKKYSIPNTIIREFKPKVDKKHAMRKYDIANEMCKIALERIEPYGKYLIDTMNSGVRITRKENDAMVLVRYSNTGPTFTASGESINSSLGEFMFKLGGAIMNLAVKNVKEKMGEFKFDWANFSKYGETTTKEANNILSAAVK